MAKTLGRDRKDDKERPRNRKAGKVVARRKERGEGRERDSFLT